MFTTMQVPERSFGSAYDLYIVPINVVNERSVVRLNLHLWPIACVSIVLAAKFPCLYQHFDETVLIVIETHIAAW